MHGLSARRTLIDTCGMALTMFIYIYLVQVERDGGATAQGSTEFASDDKGNLARSPLLQLWEILPRA